MKIGIITILKVENYGAELQAYATQAILKKLGYDAEIIDYLFYKNPGHNKTKASSPVLQFSFHTKLKEWLYPKITSFKSILNRKTKKRRTQRFIEFHTQNTSLSETYSSIDKLFSSMMNYDVYITGSDQVWNPGIFSSLEPYFLTFAPKSKKRIAYAASFGVEKLPDKAFQYYRSRLNCYHTIGVREKQAVELIKGVAEIDAKWVLDPTLLLNKEEWMEIAKPLTGLPNKPFILIYELTPCQYIKQLAKHISLLNGWEIVRVCKDANKVEKDGSIINITDAGPSEFLYLFANASAIITNSFHGTAFSINFKKDFYTVLPLRKKNNSRQRSILELFNLCDRILVEDEPFPDITSLHVTYNEASHILDREKNKSIEFLKVSIDGK